MFTGFSWFSGRDKHRICHDLRHQFGSMFARVVTTSRPPEKHLKFTAKFRLRLQPAGESPAKLSQIVAFHAFGAHPHVNCLLATSATFLQEGLISEGDRHELIKQAAASDCGKAR